MNSAASESQRPSRSSAGATRRDTNIAVVGVGGMGIEELHTALVLAAAAVRTSGITAYRSRGVREWYGTTFGMLRVGSGVRTPLIAGGTADLLIGLEPLEAVRLATGDSDQNVPPLSGPGRTTVVCVMRPVAPDAGSVYPSKQQILSALRRVSARLILVDPEQHPELEDHTTATAFFLGMVSLLLPRLATGSALLRAARVLDGARGESAFLAGKGVGAKSASHTACREL